MFRKLNVIPVPLWTGILVVPSRGQTPATEHRRSSVLDRRPRDGVLVGGLVP